MYGIKSVYEQRLHILVGQVASRVKEEMENGFEKSTCYHSLLHSHTVWIGSDKEAAVGYPRH